MALRPNQMRTTPTIGDDLSPDEHALMIAREIFMLHADDPGRLFRERLTAAGLAIIKE